MKRLFAVLLVFGCGGGSASAVPPRPVPTESDACTRICERMVDCSIAPPSCTETCARDQARLRIGVQPSLAACLERELDRCTLHPVPERRQAVALCMAALMEAYGKDTAAGDSIVHAICAREQRCSKEAPSIEECEGTLRSKPAFSAQSKALSLVRPELVTSISKCVETLSCTEDDPVAACSAPRDEAPHE